MCQGFLEWLCGSSCLMTLGIFNLMCNVYHPKEKVLTVLWELRGFWEQGDIGEYN
jgi:hypothetical protein